MKRNREVEVVIEATCEYFNITPDQLKDANRDPVLVLARTIAISQIKERTRLNNREAGKAVGLSHWSTVYHALEKVCGWYGSINPNDRQKERQRVEVSELVRRKLEYRPEYPQDNNLFEAIERICGVVALESELQEIKEAVEKDKAG